MASLYALEALRAPLASRSSESSRSFGHRFLMHLHHPTKKLDHWWIGPFVILKVISHAAVKLKLMAKERGVHPVISVSNIYHYTPEEVPEHPADPCPGSDVIDGEEEYKVEKILDSKYW